MVTPSFSTEVTAMSNIQVERPPTGPQQPHRSWFARHRMWTLFLLGVLLAVATGAMLCTIY